MVDVRLATTRDRERVVESVSLAFHGDPAWDFILGVGNVAAATTFAAALFDGRVARGTVWVADGGAAVAMWDRVAAEPRGSDTDDIWPQFRVSVGDEVWASLEAYDAAVKASGPTRPYWYLGVLATHPDRRGEGLASAVLRPGIGAADIEGWDCWLETSTTDNVAFYGGRGFLESTPVVDLDGPPTWWLRRPSAGAAAAPG